MTKQTILILGAGPDQLPIYKAARRLGLRIIGADGRSDAVARPWADQFLPIKTTSGDEIVQLLGDTIPDGVVSPGNDSFHRAIYYLTNHYHLPSLLTETAVEASCNKAYFCEQMAQQGICVPRGKSSRDATELEAYARAVGLPLIVKPIDASGNKGVTCVQTYEDLVPALTRAFNQSPGKHVLVEEYIEGQHGGMEVFRLHGVTRLMAVSQRHHSGPPDFLTLKHVVGLPMPAPLAQKMARAVNTICDTFGIHNGPLNLDFVIRGEAIYFLEMGARLSGNGFPFLVKQCYGWDTYEMALRVALGQGGELEHLKPAQQNIGGILIVKSAVSGTLEKFEHLETIRQHPAFVEEHLFVQPGMPVTAFSQANHRLGYFMVASPHLAEIEDILHIFDHQFAPVLVQTTKKEKFHGN